MSVAKQSLEFPVNTSPLTEALKLNVPSRERVLQRAPEVQQFWLRNQSLLKRAWSEWEASNKSNVLVSQSDLFDASLKLAVKTTWMEPESEQIVKKHWQEVSPGVFRAQFFDPKQLHNLRTYLDSVEHSEIPLRAPYGIVFNRNGAMLDERSEGYLAAPSFQEFYKVLTNEYLRPIARLLFPEIYGYDNQSFGFSIQYQEDLDTSLRMHTDASSVTLNINLNLPGEAFSGSEVEFYDPNTGKLTKLVFEPGVAFIHRGNVAHRARPIIKGTRTNLVLWLYGEKMTTPPQNMVPSLISPKLRWALPTQSSDGFAPF